VSELVSVRPAREGDLASIDEIYNHYVLHTAITFDVEPLTPVLRAEWFADFGERGRYRLFVAEEGGGVVGYAGSRPFRQKAAYETTVETTVYVAPGLGARGIGSSLYGALMEALGEEDIHRAVAGITLPNPASLALHARFGFESVGVYDEVGRKFGRFWSVEWMQRAL
jgi:phosphinothricin acetyltransferase